MPLQPAQIVNKRYQIIALLGQGGMGAVYQAKDLRLDQIVALKENIGGDARQFQQEALLLAGLRHPNLPRVIDHFVEPTTGVQYLVMDFIAGDDLETRLRQQGALTQAQALGWLNQILDAVEYLHAQGVIHRDIKPANIKITPQGQAVLVDFGIAKMFQPGRSTMTGARAATPGYAAPEQYRGGTDPRSDVYSLGATLYALFMGGDPPDAVALERGFATLTPPSRLNASVSAQIEQVILRAMAVLPHDRFQSLAEMQQGLAMSSKIQVPLVQSQMLPTYTLQKPVPLPHTSSSASPIARNRTTPSLLITFFIAGLLVLCVLGIGEYLLLNNASVTASRPTATPTRALAILPSPVLPTIVPLTVTAVPTVVTKSTAKLVPTIALPTISERAIGGALMVFVPSGEFNMGSDSGENIEKPIHTVYLDAFWIDKFEVTNAQFQQFASAKSYKTDAEKEGWAYVLTGSTWAKIESATWRTPSGANSNITNKINHPVNQVSWNDANAFCVWAGKRLPTEAEWEKTARGIDGRIYPWGNTFDANKLNSSEGGRGDTTIVGNFTSGASPYGAMDMAGNVWEWVADWYDQAYYSYSPRNNPQGPTSGVYRVLRGGSWYNDASNVRTTSRGSNVVTPGNRSQSVGFRCAQ